jgi:flagellar hook assembly protein FlgD
MLLQNYPNPFNPETWIPYQLSADSEVVISIYDTNGESVRQFHLGYQHVGTYITPGKAVYWDGEDMFGELVASGLYFYQIRAGDYAQARRMVIVK